MASKGRAQRIGIWIIAIVMTVGTIGSFAVIILENDNQKIDQANAVKQQETYEAQMAAYQKEQAAKSEALVGYTPRTFDAAAVADDVKVEVLTAGTGDAIKVTDSINASYFGWTSDGAIFDSSDKKDVADSPATFALSGVIKGWTEGLTGVKVGSVVRLTIPAEKAYGEAGSGAIPANAPLEFIVVVHKIDNTAAPTN